MFWIKYQLYQLIIENSLSNIVDDNQSIDRFDDNQSIYRFDNNQSIDRFDDNQSIDRFDDKLIKLIYFRMNFLPFLLLISNNTTNKWLNLFNFKLILSVNIHCNYLFIFINIIFL